MSGPDPKPKRRRRNARIRQVDRSACKRCLLEEPACVVCGHSATNADHIVRKGAPYFGDDVVENLLSECGSGTTGCHGARHGNSYVDASGKRWTPEEVRHKIGLAILARPRKLAYVYRKIGSEIRTLDFLERTFGLSPSELDTPLTRSLDLLHLA